MSIAADMEDAHRCAELWDAVIKRAKRDASGKGLSIYSATEDGQRAAKLEAQEFLEHLRSEGVPF